MTENETTSNCSGRHDPNVLRAEGRVLRRKLSFWRRTVWLLLGVIIVVAAVAYQRGIARRSSCKQSLEHFAELANRQRLETAPLELMDAEWRNLDSKTTARLPGHYELIVDNWLRQAVEGESLPLAVCGHAHQFQFSSGRHVLFREVGGDQVRWLAEAEALSIVKQALENRGEP